MAEIDLSSLVPFESESRWSDTLTALARTDPAPLLAALGLPESDPGRISIVREVPWARGSLPDVLVRSDGGLDAVLVSKVLGDYAEDRLQRYAEARPGAQRYVVLHPGVFGARTPPAPWRAVAWEDVLDAFAASDDAWVAATAIAWCSALADALPELSAGSRWDDVERGGSGIGVAMRARMTWLAAHPPVTGGVDVRLHGSPDDNGWVIELRAPASSPGYAIVAEIDEQLSPRYFADPDAVPKGLTALVCLEQSGVRDSEAFDWELLLALWPAMAQARADWSTAPARPKAPHDLAGQRSIVGRGAPAFLGAGFGDKNARDTGVCMFGARVRLAGDAALGELADEIGRIAELVAVLARIERPAL